jgi:hypothetical protein
MMEPMGSRGRRVERGKRWLACVALAAAGALVACRALVGIHDQPEGAGGSDGGARDGQAGDEHDAGSGGIAWASPACASCVEGSCATPLAACLADTGCAQSFACLERCAGDDDMCRSTCFAQGDDTLAALLHCQALSCASDAGCGLQCGGFLGVAETDTAACTACYVQWACNNAAWCATVSLACLGRQVCLDACNPLDWVCLGNCLASHEDDVPDAQWQGNFPSTVYAQCAGACEAGPDWACVGHVTWPVAHTATVTLTVVVTDLESGSGLPGIQLRLCPNGDTDCATPLDGGTVTTGDGGAVTLTLPAAFAGYIEATGDPSYAPMLTYFYPPMAESLNSLQYQGIQLLSSNYVASLAAGVSVPLDPSLGILVAESADCDGQQGVGVSFGGTPLGDAAVPYYLLDGIPTPPPEATATAPPSFLGGIVNVQPGTVDFVASVDGGTVSRVSVSVRGGGVTWLRNLVPTP